MQTYKVVKIMSVLLLFIFFINVCRNKKKVIMETHFTTLKLQEHKNYNLENSIDPDEHLCQNLQRECGCYSEDELEFPQE